MEHPGVPLVAIKDWGEVQDNVKVLFLRSTPAFASTIFDGVWWIRYTSYLATNYKYELFLAVLIEIGIPYFWHIIFGMYRFWHLRQDWVYREFGYILVLAIAIQFGIHWIWHLWQDWVYLKFGYTMVLAIVIDVGIRWIRHNIFSMHQIWKNIEIWVYSKIGYQPHLT